jgi:dipeptidyl aminopeptidase/acylaminoacyl peptidase
MARFDRLILAVVLGLGLTIALLSIASARFGPSVGSLTTAQTLGGTSVNTQIALTFSDRMNMHSVERYFRLTPHVAGSFNWSGNELLFSPRHPLQYGTRYAVTVAASARDTSGRHLFRAYHGGFTTQPEQLLYLGTSGSDSGRLVLATANGHRRIVGPNDGSVTGYSVSLDGTLAVFVRRDSAHGRPDEIWMLSLSDGSTQLLFKRTDWSISQPHLSPDQQRVVFLATNVRICRPYYGCFRNATGPVIYLLSLRSHQARQFRSASDTPITDFIDFSPAGQLAFTDLGSALTLSDPSGKRIQHVPNQGNSLIYVGFDPTGAKAAFVGQTPSSSGGDILVYGGGRYLDVSKGIYDSSTPAFSWDGKHIAYAAYRGELAVQPIYGINAYDFASKQTRKLTRPKRQSDWAPAWSPDGKYIAFVRSQPQESMYMGAGQIWVMNPDGSDKHSLGGVGEDIHWVS